MKHYTIATIGHSTHSLEEFIELLRMHAIRLLVDVRTIPRSHAHPQFGIDQLPDALQRAGIEYVHLAALGGLRHPRKDSLNAGWRNASFRGFADYMATPAFWTGLDELEERARRTTTVIMCAEAVPWRCHRSLIADALTIAGWRVSHIISKHSVREHTLTPFLRVKDGLLIYPPVTSVSPPDALA
ncbi:DUF488 domain-containing protein [Dictyobacter aurantiacus]|nr:DUF488 domain-containing protein [Dictyobacter aurantiacus]